MPPKTRSNNARSKNTRAHELSPIPVAGFMPPPPRMTRPKPEVVVKPAAPKKKVVVKTAAAPPSKANAAKDIELAARALLKLSKQLNPKK